jgi:hypothetical protein
MMVGTWAPQSVVELAPRTETLSDLRRVSPLVAALGQCSESWSVLRLDGWWVAAKGSESVLPMVSESVVE